MHSSTVINSALFIALFTLTTGCGGLPDEAVERHHKDGQGETVTPSLNKYTNDKTLSLFPEMPSIQTLTLDNAQIIAGCVTQIYNN